MVKRKVVLPLLAMFWLLQGAYSQTVTRIDITPSSTTMRVGEQLIFTARGKDASGNDVAIPRPQWIENEFTLQNLTTTCTFTAARTGHFTLTCKDATSGIEASVGISVIAACGDTSEIYETTGSPPPLTRATLVALNGNFYLFGGSTESGSGHSGKLTKPSGAVLNSTWSLDIAEARWEEEATYDPPPARQNHAAATDGVNMYVFGGENGSGSYLNDLWAYHTDNQTWTHIIIDPPLEGVSGASAYMLPDGTVIICGGYIIRNGEKVSNFYVWRVNTAAGSSSRYFTSTSSPVWYPLGVTPAGDQGYELSMLDNNFNQVGTYNNDTGEWIYQDMPGPSPQPGLENVQTIQMGKSALVSGTRNENGAQTVESWDCSFLNHFAAQITIFDLFNAAAAILKGDGESFKKAFSIPLPQLYIFGGEKLDGSLSDETVIYTPPYERDLASITVTPNEAQIAVNEIIRFAAIGRDAENFPTSVDPVWSSSGGSIDQLGYFTATQTGDFIVTATVDGSMIEGAAWVHVGSGTTVGKNNMVPHAFMLGQNYPNPFNPVTNIDYQLPADSDITLQIVDIRGMVVLTLINERQSAGYHKIKWDGRDANGNPVAGGLYLYHLKGDGFSQTKKMILIK
ncbi:MAG: kelch repeat-containing protein [candidate division KSB1 bacterium]|jgi:hypothetical protein|nr:kelch repeat-containing protein [candidate division KSB1 bacterium]